MSALLDNPIIQSSAIPFISALILVAILNTVAGRWRGVAAWAGFYLAAVLIAGVQLLPLTSTRKILILAVVASLMTLFFAWSEIHGRLRNLLLAVLVVAAACWVEWPLLMRYQGMQWWGLAGGSLIYLGWTTVVHDGLRRRAAEQLLALMVFASATAIAATLGATALIGQLAGAVAAASGALLLLALPGGKGRDDDMLLLPLILAVGLFGIAAVAYARLPWQSLVALMVIPLVPRIPLTIERFWIKIIAHGVIMLPFAATAVYIAWNSAGDSYF